MFERIMVPLDGTPLSEQALGPALAVARNGGGELHLVTVGKTAAERDPLVEILDDDYLDRMAVTVREAGVSKVSTRHLHGDKVSDVLQAYRQEVAADLIVMCTHGRGGVRRAWLGSVADELVRSSEAPLLLVRASSSDESHGDVLRTPRRFSRVVVALDGTHFSRQALDAAARLGGKADTAYTLVHVVVGSGGTADQPSGKEQLLAEGKMRLEVQAFASEGYAVKSAISVSPSVAQGILELAASHDADVIAIATHGRSGVGRLVLGSVADELVRSADLPVLVVRPSGA